MKTNTEKRPSAGCKDTKKSGLTQVTGQINSFLKGKCRSWHIAIDGSDGLSMEDEEFILHAHTTDKMAVCPCCGKRSHTVHCYRLRKIQCTELLEHHTTLLLKTRHFACTNPKCDKKYFAEPLRMTHPYGRNTYEVEERMRHEALGQTSRRASETLGMQHLHISASACIRALRLMGKVNPEVRTSGYVGLDDFAKQKGHKYMCVVVDHYTREVLAVFDSRYGQEIIDWLASHPEIKVVTRDGSQTYADIIRAASELIMQISDRFHLMQALKRDAVEPIKALLGRRNTKMAYPYPSEEEAYRYIIGDILQMGDARHRDKVSFYYEVRRMKDEGKSISEIAGEKGVKPHKVYTALETDVSKLLSKGQKQAMKVAREMARIISTGVITPNAVMKRMKEMPASGIVARCMRGITERYKVLREEVRDYNKSLEGQAGAVKVSAAAIWNYIVTGKTESEKLRKLCETHPEVEQIIQICMGFRRMLHDEDGAPTMDEWLRQAGECQLKEIRGFAEYIRKDRAAVEMACKTAFNNGLLEGNVNRIKAIKRIMFNRASPEVLRAKIMYGGLKWDWNHHTN